MSFPFGCFESHDKFCTLSQNKVLLFLYTSIFMLEGFESVLFSAVQKATLCVILMVFSTT